MFKRHMTAIGLVLALLGATSTQAQDLNLSPEELQTFLNANQGLTPEELGKRLQELNDKTLDAQSERSKTGYSFANPPELSMRAVRIRSKGTPASPEPLTLGQGIITAVAFVDDQFRPLPISDVVHDPNVFSVNGDGCVGDGQRQSRGAQGNGNTLNIYPCQFWAQGTVNVTVQGASQPIIFSAKAGSREERPTVDAMVTVEVDDGASNEFPDYASRRLTINPVDRSSGGVTPIYPGLGVITDVAFIDSSGNPWPVEKVVHQASMVSVNGSQCASESEQGAKTQDSSGNVIYLSLCRDRSSNISVQLQGAPAALGLLLVSPGTNQSAMKRDVTLSVTVPGRSPTAVANATAAASALPQNNVDRTGFQPDRFLTDFVNGTPPRGARFVQMLGAPNIEGYVYNGQLYVRGRYRPINPTADASASSSSGAVNVWRYNKPVNSLIVSDAQTGQEFSLTADY
ncbi:DotH/IcmK family type IV secretion protein [Paracoccus sp. TOH]|uniref:DotH/IcmK family type IV secretion protein n=1 Tax=Paracoccus sp. TOH TaxID=1263728 RepID=UPI0025B01777|nr:DotH/IcmK family type IV secretion protein [Paracoccus sp. TOH]WJS87257.1 DotH/IcmK family type IV secretion protein [Paracoccus sp. TOH]